MKVADLLEKRRQEWIELEALCKQLQSNPREFARYGEQIMRFGKLYRSACSDLALAERYQLPPTTVDYLHDLVAKSHNQLYRSQSIDWSRWWRMISRDVPRAIFADPCVHIAALIFFGLFTLSALLGRAETLYPNFPAQVVGNDEITKMEEMYEKPPEGNLDHYVGMAAYYIQHNTSIGLTCFGKGPMIIPCVIELAYQAVHLGCIFGYMARPGVTQGENFFHFVTAHGPFELTAIALAAAAGLRVGVGLIATAGYRRLDSLRTHALKSLPIIAVSVVLFFAAAFTEGFISPSPLPYSFKAGWALVSSTAMMLYFVALGHPEPDASVVVST
jgi:uncharacterized membrane protein SpoIIM required for sporulation